MSLLSKILSGAGWNIGAQLASQAVSFGTMIFLARWLSPGDFGLVAMCAVIKSFAFIFSNLGMSAAIVQRKELNDRYASTAFWVTLIGGLIITFIVMGSAPLVSWFFGRRELTLIVAITSVTFLLGGLSSTHRSLLEREMRFRALSAVDVLRQIGASSVALAMAFHGMGYWSLVGQEIAANAFGVPLLWKAAAWRPKLIFHGDCFRDLFGFSSYVLFSSVINFFNRNGDNIIIGRILGASALGLYDLAYNLMLKPLQYISFTIGRALYPALSQIQDDKAQVRDIYLQTVRIISLVTFPMMAGLAITAPDLIPLVFGAQWKGTIPVFEVLCFVGAFQSVGTTVGTVLLSQGRSELAFKMTVAVSPIIWLAFFVGTFWDIKGVAIAYTIFAFGWWFCSHYIANRIIALSMHQFLRQLLPAVAATIFMSTIVSSLSMLLFFGHSVPPALRLSAIVISGTLSYFSILIICKNYEIWKLYSVIRVRLKTFSVGI